MSKLSFRARAIDANKPMPVYRDEEIPDLLDFTAVNRAVLEMPTGMEKEEETEHHLQRALSAQQVYGTAEALVIPIPDMDIVGERYLRLYGSKPEFRAPKQYIHVQPFGMDQEIPEYDMDSEDEQWLNRQVKHLKMDVSPLKFESMMDRLEKGSGQMVVTLNEAKALLKVDDDLIIAVYDYWLNKRLRLQHALIPQVKTEKRDGSTTNNPYVAFRRRTEKMQTRKNRKNDEVSYEKMLKLKKDLNKALLILELLKRREKSKKELLKLTVEVAEKRYQMQDWDGKLLAEANAKKHTLPSFFPVTQRYPVSRDWETVVKEPGAVPRKKREYKKRKHKQVAPIIQPTPQPTVHLPNYVDVTSMVHRGLPPVSDDDMSAASQSDHEADNDPDGVYAFRRKAGCFYHMPRPSVESCWPWNGKADGGAIDSSYRYSLTALPTPASCSPTMPRPASMQRERCIGFARRRIGRGGRVVIDRGFTDWDDELVAMDLSEASVSSGDVSDDYLRHVRQNAIPFYRTKAVAGCGRMGISTCKLSASVQPFSDENFRQHCEELIRRRQEHQRRMSNGSAVSESAPLAIGVTLDPASAVFAASAYCDHAATQLSGNLIFGTSVGEASSSSGSALSVNNSLCTGNLSSQSNLHTNCLPTDGSSEGTLTVCTMPSVSVDSRPSVANSLPMFNVSGSVVASSRQLSLVDGSFLVDGHSVDSVRPSGNCVGAASSLSNHSAFFRGASPSCQSASMSFAAAAAPLLKSSNVAVHQIDVVSRESRENTDLAAVIMEVT